MKKLLLIVIVLVFLAFATLIVDVKLNKVDCDDLEKIFAENKEAFQNAATVMLNQHCEKGILILTEDPQNDRTIVAQVGNLYFETVHHRYPDEVYEEIYAAVEPLFEKKLVDGISFASSTIQFCVQLYIGVESSLFYSPDSELSGSFPDVEEQRLLEENWYAFVCHD